MILYHGTDIDSALHILNHGLDAAKLTALQLERPTQLGRGWYATYDAEVVWFFASLAPGAVIEIDIPEDVLNQLVEARQAIRSAIVNVPFEAQQYWFDLGAFVVLNARATFRPYAEQEPSHG